MFASKFKTPKNSVDFIYPCLFKRVGAPDVAEQGIYMEGTKNGKSYSVIMDLNYRLIRNHILYDFTVQNHFVFPVPSPIGLSGRTQTTIKKRS